MKFLPQIIFILLTVLSQGIVLAKHGEPRPPHSFWTSLIATIISVSICYWGGFFDGLIAAIK
jgi:hypothetical protein